LSALNHALLLSACLFRWMLNRVWLCFPLFSVFFQLLRRCDSDLLGDLILVSGCSNTHSAYVFLTCSVVPALDSLLVLCDLQALFVIEQFLPHPGDFACSIVLTSSSNCFFFTFTVAGYFSISSIFTFSNSSLFVSVFSCASSPLEADSIYVTNI